uniref:MyTH4 domain-containing protein n=1 Tax=Cyanistes caeruleus TaxID=156563 RepID=A0A8C0ZJL6_CYACU
MAGQGSSLPSTSSPWRRPTSSICLRRGKRSPGTSRARWRLRRPWLWPWPPLLLPRSWTGKPRWVLAWGCPLEPAVPGAHCPAPQVSPAGATFAEGDGVEQLRDVTGACPMLAFAQRHFRAARRGTTDSRGMKMPSVLEMLTFTKIPIQESLIEFVDGGLNKLAAEAFQAVMKFMGDHPLRGQTELDAVCTILKLCAEHEVLRDEVFCQIIKQTTNNTSSKPDSCQRGWRLLYILAAYYKCSEVLWPFLLAFLQDASRHPELPFHGIAKACEQNLRKTQQFGGRSLFPSSMELKAMVAGRSAKRQLFFLPGGIERHLKIKTCSVALDVIEELCCEMGLQNPEALEEYILFVVTDRGQSVRPLTRREYVLDVAAETELRDTSYTFWCRRVVWSQPLKFDNELYVTVHYNQVGPPHQPPLGPPPCLPQSVPRPQAVSLCSVPLSRCSLTTSRGCSPSCRRRGRESSTSRTWPSWPPSSTEPRTATTSPPRTAGDRAPAGGETRVPQDLGPAGQHWP